MPSRSLLQSNHISSTRSLTEEPVADESKEIERILKLDPKDRTCNNIKRLNRSFESNRFFKQQAELFEQKTIKYLFQNLRYAEYEA